jgi:hypothetical protein
VFYPNHAKPLWESAPAVEVFVVSVSTPATVVVAIKYRFLSTLQSSPVLRQRLIDCGIFYSSVVFFEQKGNLIALVIARSSENKSFLLEKGRDKRKPSSGHQSTAREVLGQGR